MKTQRGYLRFMGALCILFSFIFCDNAWSQISYGGLPYAYSDTLSFKRIKAKAGKDVSIKIKDIDKEMIDRELEEINSCKDCDNGFFYGKEVDVGIDFLNVARSVEINDREKLWFLKIESEKAEGYQLIFSKFWLPQGGKLFIYNEDKSMFLGSFTAENNRADSTFLTQYITGQDIYVEYLAPKDSEDAHIYVDKVVYIFDKCFSQNAGPFSGDGGAAECHLNTACSAGKGLDIEIKSTVMILEEAAPHQYWGICTGTLINDGLDYAAKSNPYLLTANHCYESIDEKSGKQIFSNPKDWLFLFRHEAADCNSDGSDVSKSLIKSALGARIVIRDEKSATSDYLLLELNNTIKEISKYDIAFAGYDYDVPFTPPGNIAFPLAGVHHPKGDVKKLMVFFDPAETTSWNDKPGNDYWRVTSAKGFKTEPGSSGSALFNSKHRVIGICRGGNDKITCSSDRSLFQTFYGKLSEADKKGDLISYLPFTTTDVYMPKPEEVTKDDFTLKVSVLPYVVGSPNPKFFCDVYGSYAKTDGRLIKVIISSVINKKPFDNAAYWAPYNSSDERYIYNIDTLDLNRRGDDGYAYHSFALPAFTEIGEYKAVVTVLSSQDGYATPTIREFIINITAPGTCKCGVVEFVIDNHQDKYAPGSSVTVSESAVVLNFPNTVSHVNPNKDCYLDKENWDARYCGDSGWQPKYAGIGKRTWRVDGDTVSTEYFNTAAEYILFNPGVCYRPQTRTFPFTAPGAHTIEVLLTLVDKFEGSRCLPPKLNTFFDSYGIDSNYENRILSGRAKIIVADCEGTKIVDNETSPLLSVFSSSEKEVGAGTIEVENVTLLERKHYAVEAYKNIVLKSGTLIKKGSSFSAKIVPCPAIARVYSGKVEESVVAVSEEIPEPVSDNHIVVYPNPSNGKVNVETSGKAGVRKLEVYDLNGKMVESRCYVFSNPYTLDLSGLSGGIYVLKVYSSLGVDIHKIMINK